LKNVFLYYREVGDLHWSKARTEITDMDGNANSFEIDFAAEYAYGEENDYGYSSLKWSLANKVPDGTYEIRVDTECDALAGPADMDLYSTPILSGIIDLTPPEQYGRALPLGESVLIGEEVVVAFTEPVKCETFDLLVTIDDIGVHLDRNDPPIQIVCVDRKVGFQIDPTQINVEDWIGMKFTVEIGKIDTPDGQSKSNVFDLNGNAIERNIEFEKTFASIDLNQASTSFEVTLIDMDHCSNVTSEICSDEVKDKIKSNLGLTSNDSVRVEVESVSQATGSTVTAKIKILPTNDVGRMLRQSKMWSKSSPNTHHSVGFFRKLQKVVEKEQSATDTEFPVTRTSVVSISNMKIIPGHSDMKLIRTDPGMLSEEEELYHYASMKGNTGVKQAIMSNVVMQSAVEEIASSSKAREEVMMNEIERMSNVEDALFQELKESKAREEAVFNKEAMMNEIERMIDVEDALFHELKESKAREDESKAREEAMLHELKESKSREEAMVHELKESKSREEAREEERKAREEAREEERKAREEAMMKKIERMMNKI